QGRQAGWARGGEDAGREPQRCSTAHRVESRQGTRGTSRPVARTVSARSAGRIVRPESALTVESARCRTSAKQGPGCGGGVHTTSTLRSLVGIQPMKSLLIIVIVIVALAQVPS